MSGEIGTQDHEESPRVIATLRGGSSTRLVTLEELLTAVEEAIPIERVYMWIDLDGAPRLIDVGSLEVRFIPSHPASTVRPDEGGGDETSPPSESVLVPEQVEVEPSEPVSVSSGYQIDKVIPATKVEGGVVDSNGKVHKSLLAKLGFTPSCSI